MSSSLPLPPPAPPPPPPATPPPPPQIPAPAAPAPPPPAPPALVPPSLTSFGSKKKVKKISKAAPPAPPPMPPPAPVLMEGGKKVKKSFPTVQTRASSSPVPALSLLQTATSIDVTKEYINWNQIIGFQIAGGSGPDSAGVIIVEVKPNCNVVVKGTPNVAGEFFASEMAVRMFGLCAPKHRLLEYAPNNIALKNTPFSIQEWSSAKYALFNKARKFGHELKLKKDLNRAFFLLMEFIAGESLQDIYGKFDSNEPFENSLMEDILNSKNEYLRDIGKAIVMDCILNNWDRIPSILWDNDGNDGNILFSRERKRCVFLDQTVCPIITDVGLKNYIERVKGFVKATMQCRIDEDNVKSVHDNMSTNQKDDNGSINQSNMMEEPVASIAHFFYLYSAYQLDGKAKKQILEGIKQGLQIASNISKQQLEDLKNEIDARKTGLDWENVWNNSVCEIDTDFMYSIIQIIKETLNQH